MTAPSSHPSPTAAAGSVLDGDPRILIPLPEAAERLGISRWQAYKLARSGRLPTTRLGARDLHVPAAVLRRIEQEGLPLLQSRMGVRWRERPRRARRPCAPAGQPRAE
jgi:excisionase family DNA binding protein